MHNVKIGETWSCLATHSRRRIDFVVERIEKLRDELRAFGTPVGGGKEVSFAVSALAKGARGARLVRHADGHVPYKAPPDKGRESTATASDFRREKAPKGILTAPPRMEEAFAMRSEGVSIGQIAAHFGVKTSTASGWIQRVHERIADERVRRQLSGRST